MKPISFRLRKEVDADLIEAIEAMGNKQVADLCRNGLRLMLGIRTTRQAQIVEKPIAMPEPRGGERKC